MYKGGFVCIIVASLLSKHNTNDLFGSPFPQRIAPLANLSKTISD